MTSSNPLSKKLSGARVIVTGASGFIGLNMVKTLIEMGAEVLVIDRTQPAEHVANMEFEWADLRHLDQMYEADFLIHLAAVTNAGYAEKYPLDTYETNVLGTLNLLNHVQIKERILFPSTALVYRASSAPLTEESELELASTYAQSKIIGEQVVKFHCARMSLGCTIVRFFNVFGPGQLPLYIVPQVVHQTLDDNRVVIRNGSVVRDMLYVDDCIDAVLKLAVEPGASGATFNIGSGQKVTIAEIAQAAVEVSGIPEVEIVDLNQKIEYSPTAIIADTAKVRSAIDWQVKTSLGSGLKKMFDARIGAKR